MEKNSFDKKIFVFMVVVFMVVIQMSTVYAINKDSEGYSLSKGQKFIKGFRFTSTIAKTFFIPTATTAEWSSFLANLPLGISRCTPKAGTWTTKVFGNDCTAAEPACGKTTYGKESWSRTCVGAECGGDCIGATSGHRDCEDVGAACPCDPLCPLASTVCLGCVYTGDNYCNDGADCNVVGTKTGCIGGCGSNTCTQNCKDASTMCTDESDTSDDECGGTCNVKGIKAIVDGYWSGWTTPNMIGTDPNGCRNINPNSCDGKCNEEIDGHKYQTRTYTPAKCEGSDAKSGWMSTQPIGCKITCNPTCDDSTPTCDPECPAPSDLCKTDRPFTGDDGCPNGKNCNVKGTVEPIVCPDSETIECGKSYKKDGNACGAGCDFTGTKDVDGVWSGWVSANTKCYAYCNPSSCGKEISGSTYWKRTCTNPAPSCGGETCSGGSTGWASNDCTKTCPACPSDDPPACVASCGITEKKCCDGKSCTFSLYPDYSYSCK